MVGDWWLVIGGWWLVAVGSGWQLAVGRRWRLAAVGGWRLAVGGPLGRSLAKKKSRPLRTALPPLRDGGWGRGRRSPSDGLPAPNYSLTYRKILLPSAKHLEEGRGTTFFELLRQENCISRLCPRPLGSPPPPPTPKWCEKQLKISGWSSTKSVAYPAARKSFQIQGKWSTGAAPGMPVRASGSSCSRCPVSMARRLAVVPGPRMPWSWNTCRARGVRGAGGGRRAAAQDEPRQWYCKRLPALQ